MKNIFKLLLKIILPVIFLCYGLLLFFKFITLFIPFIIAWLISLIINPLVKKINVKLKLKNKILNKLLIIGIIVGAIFLICYLGYKVAIFIPEVLLFVTNKLTSLDINIEIPFLEHLDFASLKDFYNQYSSQLINISEKVLHVMQDIPGIIIRVFVAVMASYYFVVEEFDVNKILKKIIPDSYLSHYELIKNNAKTMFSQYFIAQFKISGVVLVILMIGFIILGVKNSFIIALLTAMLDWLPVFGTGAVIWPWALYHALSGNYTMAIGLLIIYAISQIFRHVIQPKLIGDTVGISSIATLFFMYIGFLIAGLGGMIIAVPIGVFIINLIKAGLLDNWVVDIKELIINFNNYLSN